jgi:hypothetical protein
MILESSLLTSQLPPRFILRIFQPSSRPSSYPRACRTSLPHFYPSCLFHFYFCILLTMPCLMVLIHHGLHDHTRGINTFAYGEFLFFLFT